jgi:O-methyltransferase involved in polyketide biosynthesis
VGPWALPWGSCGWPARRVTLCGIAQVRVQLSEAQETLLVTLYGRAWDARAQQPILGDTMAAAAVEQMDYDFRRAKVNPRMAASVAVRAKQFDDWTAEFLAVHDQAIVVHLADLDTTCRHTGQPCDRLRVGARRASRDP